MNKFGAGILLFIQFAMLTAAETKVTILYSNNTNGLIENCHCPEHAYGALEKRAAIIDSIRHSTPNVLLLDAGDLLDIRKNRILHSYILQAYGIMGYDAWTCGDQDFIEGNDFFDRMAHNSRMLLLCSNVQQHGDPVGSPFLVKNFDSLRIGISGTINPDLKKYLEKESKTAYQFTQQQSALQSVMKELKSRCDYIILLSHSGYDQDIIIAQWFPMINIIIGGHSQTLLVNADRRDETYIVQCGENGYRLGVLSLHFINKKLVSLQNKLMLLDDKIGNYPAVMELINSYHQQVMRKKF